MKNILVSPIFDHPANRFSGDNVAHYLPGKYLWHVCNEVKTGFHHPIDNVRLDEPVRLSYVFPSPQPQGRYFKKPRWIDEFLVARDAQEINRIAKGFDFFVNLYRYRGRNPTEVNLGYSPDLKGFNLDLVAYTYKAVYDHGLYIDDLELNDKYLDFLDAIDFEMNPDRRPVIAMHKRTEDPHDRHLADYENLNDRMLFDLLDTYKDHVLVLVGDPLSWKYYRHPRVKYLTRYVNRRKLLRFLKEYNAALQFILAGYFCGRAAAVVIGISGFTLFIESIRPRGLMPPVPVFWGPQTFSGIDTCMRNAGWFSTEFDRYNREHPEDIAFRHQVHHFMYYSRNEEILKPYCMDYPNSREKALKVLKELESAHGISHPRRAVGGGCENSRRQTMYESAVNTAWEAQQKAEKIAWKTAKIMKKLDVGAGKTVEWFRKVMK
ncbi:MAG: hypothetical protein HZB63_05815 [Deltaproteobacteria bacterium]|nr:hypothetical protein [Deltaproteobacteria bacterium]